MERLTAMGARVGAILKDRAATVAVAESAAGGLVSAALLAVPGASAYFRGGGVIYTRDARRLLLGFTGDQITMRGADEACALAMARAIRARFDVTWAIGESGAAGPSGNRYGDAAGHVAIAVVGPVELAVTVETGSADREANMWRFAEEALTLLDKALGTSE